LETKHGFGTKAFSRFYSLSPHLAYFTRGGSEMSMTPKQKSNVRLLLILIASSLVMTALWIYFIIAKEPLRP